MQRKHLSLNLSIGLFHGWLSTTKHSKRFVTDVKLKIVEPKWIALWLNSFAFSCGCRTTEILWPIFVGLTKAKWYQVLVDHHHFQQELMMSQMRKSIIPLYLFAMQTKQEIWPYTLATRLSSNSPWKLGWNIVSVWLLMWNITLWKQA